MTHYWLVVFTDPQPAQQKTTQNYSILGLFSRQQYSDSVIMGDFNYPKLDFIQNLSHLPDDASGSKFLDKTSDLLLKQHITEPTHYRDGITPSLLDLVFLNE